MLLAPVALMARVTKTGAQGPLVVLADALGFAALSLLRARVARRAGRVGEPLLRRYAPPGVGGWSALVRGPPAMVAGMATALERLGVAPATIQAEGVD